MAVRLKNPWHECPVGGFVVTIGKLNQTRQFWSFGESIDWFHGVATANPRLGLPINKTVIASFISQQNALRMLTIAGGENYISQEGGPVQTTETKKASLLKPVVVAGDKIRALAAGAAILAEWIGDGASPVPATEANRRADICAACPKNERGNLENWFTVFASETIRKQIASAQDLKLTTQSDAKLGVCTACLCPLKLKVHVPLENIKNHLPDRIRTALDPRCWVLK